MNDLASGDRIDVRDMFEDIRNVATCKGIPIDFGYEGRIAGIGGGESESWEQQPRRPGGSPCV